MNIGYLLLLVVAMGSIDGASANELAVSGALSEAVQSARFDDLDKFRTFFTPEYLYSETFARRQMKMFKAINEHSRYIGVLGACHMSGPRSAARSVWIAVANRSPDSDKYYEVRGLCKGRINGEGQQVDCLIDGFSPRSNGSCE